ncbi:NUDIX hydrolase [Blastococcus sp. Marseille-P5729]|uniref:NUDIX hydrolase n=1 Tax=Blastococcus sp. Marseille-P5729 TaxID=2086582 RepID=UPI00131BFA12|nr:NUDIX domain-containing protein [Blastococcus sp. Marseille-P5729]
MPPPIDAFHEPREGEVPTLRQRIGAYGVLVRDDRQQREILMTRISPWDYGAGMWTLPGGGIDHGEHPDDAVVREVYEETSIRVRVRSIGRVTSLHVIGRNRAGLLEDFQGVGIIYVVDALEGVELDSLQIIEQDSSTDHVEWMPLDSVHDAQGRPRDFTNVAKAGLLIAAEL